MVQGELKLGRRTVRTGQKYVVSSDVDVVKHLCKESNKKARHAGARVFSFDAFCKRSCGKRVKLTSLFKTAEMGKVEWSEGDRDYGAYVPLAALGLQAPAPAPRPSNAIKRNAEMRHRRPGMRGRRPDGSRLQSLQVASMKELEGHIRSHANDSYHRLFVRRAGGTVDPDGRKSQYYSTDGYTGFMFYAKVSNMKRFESNLIRLMDAYRDQNDNKHKVSNCQDKPGYVYVLCGDKHW